MISYSFDSANWRATRFSDGTTYRVWHSSLAIERTVHETAWHWHRVVQDSDAGLDREFVTEQRVFDVRCDALLINPRGKASARPDIVSRTSYAFTHEVGR